MRKTYRAAIREAKRAYLVELLMRNGGNVSAAAREAGTGRNTLYLLMQRTGINLKKLPTVRAVYLRESPHCPTCACGLKPGTALVERSANTTHG